MFKKSKKRDSFGKLFPYIKVRKKRIKKLVSTYTHNISPQEHKCLRSECGIFVLLEAGNFLDIR